MDRLDFDFSQVKFQFHKCACGKETTKVPCWDCTERERIRLETRTRMSQRGFPQRFDWAEDDTPELRLRVATPTKPTTLDEAITSLKAAENAALIGPTGCGKTSLAVAMAKLRGTNVLFIPADKLARAPSQQQLGTEHPLVTRAREVGLLLLDDLGCEEMSSLSPVREVLNERHNEERRTWVTSGLGYTEIGARYGINIARRIASESLIIRWTKGER